MPIVEFDCQCKSCKGTGLYVGVCERDGIAVVCHTCKGTGKQHVRFEYEEFAGRIPRSKIKRVLQTACGHVCGNNTAKGITIEDFGGQSYDDWATGKPFPPGSEMRRFACPAWWYQSVDYDKKPSWDECEWGAFSACSHFSHKAACWARWDVEYGSLQPAEKA